SPHFTAILSLHDALPISFLPNANKTTPLMAAAGFGTADPLEEAGTEPEALEATEFLLDLGADINAVDNNGETAMHGAAYGNFPRSEEHTSELQSQSNLVC